jgi:hypothetical protein
MKRLSKDRKQQRADLVTRLNDAAEAVRAALVAVNAEIAGKLNSAIENYNLILSVAEAFRDEIVSELEHYASDRSDRWQNSERGLRLAIDRKSLMLLQRSIRPGSSTFATYSARGRSAVVARTAGSP